MKNKYILLIATLLICSVSVWGQTNKSTSANSTKAITEKVQMLETNTQEQFSQLQNENKALKEQLQKMESDIALYREDVRTKESEINSNLSDWLTLLSVVIGSITTGFGVVAPLLLNYFNNKKQESKLNEIQKKIDETKADAKSAKNALSDVEKLKVDITSIKQTIEESEKAAKKSADEAQASKLFAEALAEKNPQKAIELYTEVLELDSSNVGAYNNRANFYAVTSNTSKAMLDYNKAIELDPNYTNTYYNRAILYNRLGQVSKAIEDYNKAIELDPNNTNAYFNRANLYKDLERTQDALEDYNKVIELNPTDADAYKLRAIIYGKLDKNQDALEDFNNSIEFNPTDANAYKLRAFLNEVLGNKTEALVDYRKYIELNPQNAFVNYRLANILLKAEKYDEALNMVNKAILLDDKEYTHVYHITKGEIYMAMKEFLDAINEFTFAISLKDDAKDAYKYRGECYRELAKVTSDEEKKGEYNALAEADEKKYEELDKKSNS